MNLEQEIAAVLNRASVENESNTPDFVLAQYLVASLAAFTVATQQRETWYGSDASPSPTDSVRSELKKVILITAELARMESGAMAEDGWWYDTEDALLAAVAARLGEAR